MLGEDGTLSSDLKEGMASSSILDSREEKREASTAPASNEDPAEEGSATGDEPGEGEPSDSSVARSRITRVGLGRAW